MKKFLTTTLVVIGSIALIGVVLANNKKTNEAKIEVVNASGGAAPVQVTTLVRQDMDLTYSANGTLIPRRELELKAEYSGVVKEVKVELGDRVQQGQILAVLDDKFLSLDRQTAEDAYQKLVTDVERYENAFKAGGVTQAQLDDIRLQKNNAGNRLKEIQRRSTDAFIKAPIAGMIDRKHIEVGTYLSAGNPLFDIVDVSSLKLKVSVDEGQVTRLHIGDTVDIQVPVFPEQRFRGRITFIASKADEALNFPLELQVANEAASPLKAGMFASVTFDSGRMKKALMVPRSAFVGSVNNREVYVLQADGTVRLTTVVPGAILGSRVEVLAGLDEGQQVITTGQINLQDGAAVDVIAQ